MTTISIGFKSYAESIPLALDRIGAGAELARQTHILLKPNLINADPHPVTTPAACCEAIVHYIRSVSDAAILIGEGCGAPGMNTEDVFAQLGYRRLARRLDLELVDLNTAPVQEVPNPGAVNHPVMMLPAIAMTHYLVSVPVLKAHSLADMTGTLKNMMGLLPPEHYGTRGGAWRKAEFHDDLHRNIRELNACRRPDLTVMDASVGLAAFHLGGPSCEPPLARIIAGHDPLEVDRMAAGLLGLEWQKIPHLTTPSR